MKHMTSPVIAAEAVITHRTDPKEPLLVDIPRAAALISSTPKAIRTLIRTGRLGYVHIGKKFLISPHDIVKLIEKSKVGGAA